MWPVLTWTLIRIGGVGIWKYCLQEKKSFPFNLFLPFPPLSPWKWGQRPQGALREPAAENESSHLEISAENYKLLHKDQLSLGPYSLWFFTLVNKMLFFFFFLCGGGCDAKVKTIFAFKLKIFLCSKSKTSLQKLFST